MNFPVIKEVVAYGRELEKRYGKVFKFTTTTNAVLMNDEIMDFLNREMDNVVISIDGRPEVHDRMRPTPNGKGSYDLIIEKAKEFARRRGQQRYYLRGTFTRYNLDFANDVLHLADQGLSSSPSSRSSPTRATTTPSAKVTCPAYSRNTSAWVAST